MFKSKEIEEAYNRRMGRYMAAIKMLPVDRVPIVFNTCYFLERNSGYTFQEIIYDPEKWTASEARFAEEYPEVDAYRGNILYGPTNDVVDHQLYRMPGREIPANSIQQFVEDEWMKADEYRELIDDPIKYRFEKYFPRVLGEYEGHGIARTCAAFLKAGMLQGIAGGINAKRAQVLKDEYGVPQTTRGGLTAPFDMLSDSYRGLKGIMRDMFRQKEAVKEACEMFMNQGLSNCVNIADPNKQLPIFIATHKPCFMSPKQFDEFYWPTFYEGVMRMINGGYTFRIFLEGNWEPHWEHLADFPKGTIIFDVDNEADIHKAKKAFGHNNFITGGLPTDLLILGSPEEVTNKTRELIDSLASDGGWGPQGGGHMPEDCKPENMRALCEAIEKYGQYNVPTAPLQEKYNQDKHVEGVAPVKLITPWEEIKAEHGWDIQGDEALLKNNWEKFERMAYSWIVTR